MEKDIFELLGRVYFSANQLQNNIGQYEKRIKELEAVAEGQQKQIEHLNIELSRGN